VLGRATYEIFHAAWPPIHGDPYLDAINAAPKYVVSSAPVDPGWNATGDGRVVGEVSVGFPVEAISHRLVLHEGDGVDPYAPKGQSSVTTRLVADILRRSTEPRSAADIAAELGLARATAQRYLAALARAGRAEMTLRYGSTGRPEHLYSWRAAAR
jgi:hypothetical protein